MYTYFIHSPTLSSATAGTPLGKRIVKAESFVPGETSVTMPFTITLLPCTETSGPAVTVVALGPLPTAYILLSYVLNITAVLSAINGSPPQTVNRNNPSVLNITSPVVALRQTNGAPRGSGVLRSEERRVGKECRSRWSP